MSLQAERLPIKTYTTADGLGSDVVERIVRDSRGFLWFCTRDGLSRFDGYRFVTYTMAQGLPHPTVNDLLETRRGLYWVATNGGGVCRFNPAAGWQSVAMGTDAEQPGSDPAEGGTDSLFTVYPVGDEPITNRVNVLYEDRDGRIWAGTDGGLFQLEERDGQLAFHRVDMGLRSPGDRQVGVGAFVEDQEGSLWIGTNGGLVRRFPDGRMIHYRIDPSQAHDTVTALLEDRQGRLWVGHSAAGLIRLQPDPISVENQEARNEFPAPESHNLQLDIRHAGAVHQYTTADGLANNQVWALHQTADGRIWIATTTGLTEFDGRRFRSYTTAQGLVENKVTRLAEDRDGNLWISGWSVGAMKLTVKGLTTYDEADGLGHTRIHSIFEDQSGHVWVVSGNWVINRFDGERFTSTQAQLPKDVGYDWDCQVGFLDSVEQWWLLTSKGLYRLAPLSRLQQLAETRPQAVYTSRDGLTGDSMFQLFEDSRGDIWISTRNATGSGLTRWDRATNTFHAFSQAEGLPAANAPSAFCEDRSGALWIGFYFGGLARYQGGRLTLFSVADGLPAGMITALYLDHEGRLWVATNQGGLGRLDDPAAEIPRFVIYTNTQGLSSNNVQCITEDQWGRLYLGTVRGVDRLEPETGRIKHYTPADGLANSYVNVAFHDRQGRLWFGTMKGLSRLIPEPDRPHSPPRIWIGGLRIAGAQWPVAELGEAEVSGLELGADQNQLQIDFFGLGFAAGEVLRYQFKLEGADRDWSALTDQRTINYASLSPGTYRFLVRAVSAEGLASPMPATVAFVILPPFWERWWFLLFVALAVGLAGYAVHRYRVSRLLELERVRTRIATDLHDDIGSSLSKMAILSEVVKQRMAVHDQEVARMLTQIAESARGLVDVMSDIVWSIDPRRDNLNTLVLRIGRFASDVLDPRGIACHFQTPPEPEKLKLTMDQRRHLFLIFKEALNNIARHADCAAVWLTLSVKDGRLVARIRDDGRGFSQTLPDDGREQPREGHGLENMQTRATLLGGRLEIESVPDAGTLLTLTVPLK